jgi:colanic acid/amylovoran biosynthesis glycosyltransferase
LSWRLSLCRLWDRLLCRGGTRHHVTHLVNVARREGARLLHSHFGHHGWENLEAAREAGLKHVVTFYGLDVNYLPLTHPHWAERYQELFAEVDRVLCEGPHMAQCVVRLGCPASKVRVHHLGVPVDEILYHPRRWNDSKPLRVLMAASFREKKGIRYGLQALGLLRKEVDVRVTLIGDANHEPRSQEEKQKILASIESNGLRSCVRLLGYQPYERLIREAYDHDIFLAPSVTSGDGDTEGGAPVTLIDLAASGMPIVSTRHCDIPEIIEDGVSGLLAGERDANGLHESLLRLVRDPDGWEAMTHAARLRVETEFNAPIQGRRLQQIYESTVRGALSPEPCHVYKRQMPKLQKV